jgi:hypothetical protein
MFLTPWSSRAPSSPWELAETGPAFEPDGPARFLLAQLCYEDECHFPHLENTVAPVWTAEHGVRMFVVLDVCGFHVSPGCLLPGEVVENRRMGFISTADGLIIDARAFNGCERLGSWSTQNSSPG